MNESKHLSRKRIASLSFLFIAAISPTCDGLSTQQQHHPKPSSEPLLWNRRNAIAATLTFPSVAQAAAPPALRDVDVGGGFDLLGKPRLAEKDVTYPPSMEGPWVATRTVAQVEGDAFQAESAWKALGGSSPLKTNVVESYQTRYIKSNLLDDTPAVVADRGFEMESRTKSANVSWAVESPDLLQYDKLRISVVQRKVEPPSDQGFGFNELYRIDDGLVTRAVQVKRRYRRAFDEAGNRVVEGLEIMKTFRVLDGVAGTEFPTSTTKSQLRLTRS